MTVIHVDHDHIGKFHLGDTVLFEYEGKTLVGIIVKLWSSERVLSERAPSDDDLIGLEDGCFEVVEIDQVDGYPGSVFTTNTCNIRLLDKGE